MTDPRRGGRFPGAAGAMIAAGILLAALNLVLTPRLDAYETFPELAGSSVFLTRQLLASVVALLALYGIVGLYDRWAGEAGAFLRVGFLLAFIGGATLIPLEWGQAFIIHELGQVSPDGLEALENQTGANLFDISAAILAGLFALGWIVYSIALVRISEVATPGPVLVLGGLLGLPLLAAVVGPVWGQIIGSLGVGAGWILLGLGIRRPVEATVGLP